MFDRENRREMFRIDVMLRIEFGCSDCQSELLSLGYPLPERGIQFNII